MIEIFNNEINNRESIIISLHTHNDQGMADVATELGLMAQILIESREHYLGMVKKEQVDLVICINNYFARGINQNKSFKFTDDGCS